MSPASLDRPVAAPGTLGLRRPPAGLPDAELQPPTIAAAGDPFTAARVIRLVAPGSSVADRSGSTTSSLPSMRAISTGPSAPAVVTDVLLQLQANWMADYRNGSGIVVEDGPYGASADDRGFEPGRPVDRPPGSSASSRPAGRCSTDFSRRDGSGADD